jgi:hypothetical protein
VKRAIKSGDIRKDLDPIDLLWALTGLANVASSPDRQQSARRLVDILITGVAADQVERSQCGVPRGRTSFSALNYIFRDQLGTHPRFLCYPRPDLWSSANLGAACGARLS